MKYETIVARVARIKIDRFDRSTGLHAAQALQQCANVYRKIDTPEYLSRAIEYHRHALQLKELFLSHDAIELADTYVDLDATYSEGTRIRLIIICCQHYRSGNT